MSHTAGARVLWTPPPPPPRRRVRTVAALSARRLARVLQQLPEVWVGALALALFSWRYTVPSPGWDEAITLNVVSRTADEILSLTGNVDLVHLTYYLLVHGLLGGSDSIAVIRMLSVVAAALTACVLVRIGRQLESLAVGVCAGLLFAAAPLVTRYAQDARPYALVTLTAAGATLALLRVLRRPWLRPRWVIYGGLLLACGMINLMSVFLIPAHLTYVLATTPRTVRRRWLVTAAIVVVGLVPLTLGAWLQRQQLSWLPHPQPVDLLRFFQAEYPGWPLVPLLLLVGVLGLRGARSWWLTGQSAQGGLGAQSAQSAQGGLGGLGAQGRFAYPADATHGRALLLGVSWAVLPPVLLWTVAQLHPLFDWRYVIFTLPGTALALASLAPLLRRPGVIVLIAAVAISGVHMQYVYRRPAGGHAEDIRGAAQIIGRNGRIGDAVLFLPDSRRVVALAYPDQFQAVDDVALAKDPVASATLWGVETSPADIARTLKARSRVWVVTGPPRLGETPTATDGSKQVALADGFRLASRFDTKNYEVRLYLRRPRVSVPPEDLSRARPGLR